MVVAVVLVSFIVSQLVWLSLIACLMGKWGAQSVVYLGMPIRILV